MIEYWDVTSTSKPAFLLTAALIPGPRWSLAALNILLIDWRVQPISTVANVTQVCTAEIHRRGTKTESEPLIISFLLHPLGCSCVSICNLYFCTFSFNKRHYCVYIKSLRHPNINQGFWNCKIDFFFKTNTLRFRLEACWSLLFNSTGLLWWDINDSRAMQNPELWAALKAKLRTNCRLPGGKGNWTLMLELN